MAQSVELTFRAAADAVFVEQWRRLAEAGLPSSQRAQASEHHRPHLTLYAADRISADAEMRLPELVVELGLEVTVAAVMVFGPRRGSYVLVRQVVPSLALLRLQRGVSQACGADPAGQFGPGRWSPHVTVAPRIPSHQVGAALDVLGRLEPVADLVQDCRRWDGDRRTAWWLTR